MAIAVTTEPVRIGLTVLMLNRPRPMLQLLAFLCGGFVMGMVLGLVVLFILRNTPLSATNFTVPKVQLLIGLLALLVAAMLVTNVPARLFTHELRPGTAVGEDVYSELVKPRPLRAAEKLSTYAQHLLCGSSLWVAGMSGLGIALPSIDYMAALAVILASGATPAAQAGALLIFNVVAFTLVEIPLLSYLAAPDKTRVVMAALNDWIRSRRRRDVAALLAVGGCCMVALGISGI
jgi:hypothetical protein